MTHPQQQLITDLEKLVAWLENPRESIADRSNPHRIAATIRGIIAAAQAAFRCPRCGAPAPEQDAYCSACFKRVTRNIRPAEATLSVGAVPQQEPQEHPGIELTDVSESARAIVRDRK